MCPETHKNEPQSHVFALSILPLVSILHQTRGVRKATYEKRFYGQYGVRVPNDNPLPTTTSRFSHFWPEKWPPISAKSACRTGPYYWEPCSIPTTHPFFRPPPVARRLTPHLERRY